MDVEAMEKRFLKINRMFGVLTSVWPYQKPFPRLIQRIIALTILFTSFVTQTAYLILFPSIRGIVTSMPYYILVLGTFVKMGNYFINETKLRSMLNHIFTDWATIKSKEENDIMIAYSQRGLLLTLSYALHALITGILMISWPLVPPILDILMPLNESRKRMFIYPAHYFVDHEKYYDILAIHMVIVMCMTGFVYCACDANYVYAVQHACGLLAITRYRFRNVSEGVLDQYKNDAKLSKFNYNNVRKSIQAHQHALRYLKLIETNHHTYLFISVGMLIMCICVSLLQVANEKTDSWLVQYIFLFAQLFHTLILTGQGQFVINGLDGVFISMFLRNIESTHVTYLFMCMGITLLCVSITMVEIATIDHCWDFYKFIGFLVIQLLHLFCLTMQGQLVINSSDEIYNAINEARWYNTNPEMQTFCVLALRRSLTPPCLTAGGLIQFNMQSFSEVMYH
ncbi:uncharacterized protein LOC132914648 [Bombus pascuorum]|uniref:uncharacterized protein LOC132914648 n=1 Tax=Bombus pascuorum TaxID=65598 RepID=UPI00298D749F|nr:uncharacterized protein LOC132914648 [Bombus pascuorum]